MALDSYRAVHRERSDIDLVRRANRGEASALETIYCKHNAWVFALAKRLTGNADDALDVRQDAFSYLFSRFPGFALTTTLRGFLFPVVRSLTSLGMKDAFDKRVADFSGIAKEKLYLKDVVHSAFVEVNEKGTEAAAATGVVVQLLSQRQPVVFRADHPFLFAIQERATRSILFLGRVANPS